MLKLKGAEEIANYANIPPTLSAVLRKLGTKEDAFEPILVPAFQMGLVSPTTNKKFITNAMNERQNKKLLSE